jgi:hypothetical protein
LLPTIHASYLMSFPMSSSSDEDDWGTPESRRQAWLERRQREVDVRSRYIEAIVSHARSRGLDATKEIVGRHYDWFKRWHEGILPTGHLINRTGVKWIQKSRNQKGR